METSFAILLMDALAIARGLTVFSPSFLQLHLPREYPLDEWFRMIRGDDVGYIFAAKEGWGRYSRQLPAGVNENSVKTIHIDATVRPGFLMLDEMINVVDSLLADGKASIKGRSDLLILADHANSLEGLKSLSKCLSGVKQAVSEGYNESVVVEASARIREHLITDIGAAVRELQTVAEEVAELRGQLAADGFLAGWFMLYRDICLDIDKQFGHRSKRAKAEVGQYVGYGAASVVSNPLALLAMLVRKLARENLWFLAAGRGNSYLTNGERWLDQALNSDSVEGFRSALYTAGLFLSTAHWIFQTLTTKTSLGSLSDADRDRLRRAGNVAEEKAVRVGVSFINALQDLDGGKFQYHRARIQEATRKGGINEARDVAFELIETYYYYPRSALPLLLASEEIRPS